MEVSLCDTILYYYLPNSIKQNANLERHAST